MEEINKIMYKIANYVPWQNEEITEQEFELLNGASGSQLAKVAKELNLNFARFIQNTDKIIDAFNEKLIREQIGEVKALKFSLRSSFDFKVEKMTKKRDANIRRQSSDLIDIEEELCRRNLTFHPNPIQNIETSINEQHPEIQRSSLIHRTDGVDVQNKTIPDIPLDKNTFVENLNLGETENSISIHRDNVIIPQPNNLTLSDYPRINLNSLIEQNDDLPLLTEKEMVSQGFLDGRSGRKIIETLISQKDFGTPLIEPHVPIDIPEKDRVPSNVLPVPESPAIQLNLTDQEENRLEGIQPEIVTSIQVPTDSLPPPLLQVQEGLQISTTNQEGPIEQSARVSDENRQNIMAERFESFRRAVEEAGQILLRARRRPHRRRRQISLTRDVHDDIPFNKILKDIPKKKYKRNRKPMVKAIKASKISFDLFDDVSINVANDMPFDEDLPDEEIEIEIQPQLVPQEQIPIEIERPAVEQYQPITSTPLVSGPTKRINISPLTTSNVKRLKKSTDEPNKDNTAQISDIIIPNIRFEMSSGQTSEFPEEPQREILAAPPLVEQGQLSEIQIPESVNRQEEASLQIPQLSQSRSRRSKDIDLHITADSIDLERLRRLSKMRVQGLHQSNQIPAIDVLHNMCEQISERERVKNISANQNVNDQLIIDDQSIPPPPPINIPEVLAIENERLDEPKTTGKDVVKEVMVNGEPHIEVTSNNGKLKRLCTHKEMDTLGLYLQIRFLMKKQKTNSPWKMTIRELFRHGIEMVESKSKVAIYQRLLIMIRQGLFIPTFQNGLDLIAIEIPLSTHESETDKEN